MTTSSIPQSFTTLGEWLEWQSTLHSSAIDLSLDRVQDVYHRMGFAPDVNPYVITVAGTNGKGSTVSILQSILLAANYRVGAYTSPHILHYNERVCINGRSVEDSELIEAFAFIESVRGDISLSYFEYGTLAALYIFQKSELDFILLEVGLGGRLDATNIINANLSIITSIGLDHQEWLGDDRESIGREKAGIFRPQQLAIYADIDPPNSVLVEANKNDIKLYRYSIDYNAYEEGLVWVWERGEKALIDLPKTKHGNPIQIKNAAAVIMAIDLLKDNFQIDNQSIKKGIQSVYLPGRYDRIASAPEIIVDVAHNAESCQVLADSLLCESPKRTLAVFSALTDKPVQEMLTILSPLVDEWHVAGLKSDRSLTANQLEEVFAIIEKKPKVYPSIDAAFSGAKNDAKTQDRIIVTGSFLTVSEVLATFSE